MKIEALHKTCSHSFLLHIYFMLIRTLILFTNSRLFTPTLFYSVLKLDYVFLIFEEKKKYIYILSFLSDH